ncbi:hypothetical protein SAMN05216299_104122 [Nitrosospira sp. Nsp14]|nr:hypothetical protein SAMN05216299_104122 [Nitrosospira sp. Nsp14]
MSRLNCRLRCVTSPRDQRVAIPLTRDETREEASSPIYAKLLSAIKSAEIDTLVRQHVLCLAPPQLLRH